MSRLTWDAPTDRRFQTGIDRGVLYFPNQGNTWAAWNGLISVTDQGAQSKTTYYRDGIAYLTVATPREFSAQISCYTFPDEFFEVLGIVEATDGMYMDGQVPDLFNLTYRTMYGDSNDYKIHLVYGAVATMSDTEFNTLADNTDTSTFEFDISGTPQKLTGFRPTSHVVIDSTNIDSHKLADVENILYGYVFGEPRMPTLDELYKILDFGPNVIVTDNGDGTWTAEGAMEYVKVDAQGYFTIDNVPRLDLGGGKYEFASTNETITDSRDSISEPLSATI